MAGFEYYLLFILAMIGCSVGLPYPEEVVLLGAGYLAIDEATTGVNGYAAMAVCAFGVLLGDSVVYSLGRYIGPPILSRWPFRKHFTPRRIRLARLNFVRHGGKILFPIRLVPVVRAVAHFTAGTLRYSYPRFVLWDGLGIAMIVPVTVWLAWTYGEKVAAAIREGNFWIGVTVGAGFAIWAVWFFLIRKKKPVTVHEMPTKVLQRPSELDRLAPPTPPPPTPEPPAPTPSEGPTEPI